MKLCTKNLLVIFLFLILGTSKSYSSAVTQVDVRIFNDADDESSVHTMGTVEFNNDGTKMFTVYHNKGTGAGSAGDDLINQYTLTTPYDISTATYDGDDERCEFSDTSTTVATSLGFRFSDDGMKIFVAQRGLNGVHNSYVNRLDLTTAFDISTCSYIDDVNVDTALLQDGTNAGPRASTGGRNNLQGIEITNDGTKLFLTMNDRNGNQSIKQYNFSTPYDLSTITLQSRAIVLQYHNPFGISFSENGKRLFASYIGVNPTKGFVEQYTLDNAFDISSSTLDGEVSLEDIDSDQNDLISISFSKNGLKMFSVKRGSASVLPKIFEYNLACPFTLIEGKCESITRKSDRIGIAEAQIEVAKRTINQSSI